MKAGDIVRFALWSEMPDVNDWSTASKKYLGLLIEYDSLMKLANVLYKGEIHTIRAQLVEKAGKRDMSSTPGICTIQR
tara:strand:- start:1036 stop:1269 length:234 start_codon:yes stop_codon:yes gene_type:complete